jgi:hypothetical protein
MKRIGVAASKISHGNVWLYNVYVLILTTLFAFLIVLLAGFAIFLALYLMCALSTGSTIFDLHSGWGEILKSCLVALAIVSGVFTLCAVGVNIKIK